MKRQMWHWFYFHLHLLAVKADYEKQSSSNALCVNSRFHGWSFFCLPSPHALNSAVNTSNYIFIYKKMKTRLDQITYILRQSVKSLTSWHWLLVKAAASQECGMPRQRMRAASPNLKIPLLSGCSFSGKDAVQLLGSTLKWGVQMMDWAMK